MHPIQLYLVFSLFPFITFAMFGMGNGLILYNDDKSIRSGVLSSDHHCTPYPKAFHASLVQNTGTSHCAMWTETDCKGILHVVPAHYTIKKPNVTIESVIC